MKIKLIAPREQREDTLSGPFRLQRVNLPLLAALTPPGHTVMIVDEAFAPDDTNRDVDLVGITVMTDLARRAYDIADTYRRKAVKVVMGGIHPTVLPDEALEHADAVVVGEAEGVWPKLVSDAASGKSHRRVIMLRDTSGFGAFLRADNKCAPWSSRQKSFLLVTVFLPALLARLSNDLYSTSSRSSRTMRIYCPSFFQT